MISENIKTQAKESFISEEEEKEFKEMVEKGLHFGGLASKKHPKMESIILGMRNGFDIIDLEKTQEGFKKALDFLTEKKKEKASFLVVGTKKSAQQVIKEFGDQFEIPYVNQRWIGGFLTNFEMIKKRISTFVELEGRKKKGELENYPKKEKVKLERELGRLEKKFGGLKKMERLPDVLIIVDIAREKTAIKEAKRKNIPVVGICGTNADPSFIDYPIFANVHSRESIKYIFEKIKEALE